ncbi:MAG: hypothetical protein KDA44_19830 [Planctomycetales bacterium]|nr:hypothetical protein [Planctomycetales bacterium]
MKRCIQVSAAARLHFGLTRLSQRTGPSYGGLGLMVDRPRAVVEVRPAVRWRVAEGGDARCLAVCRRAYDFWGRHGEIDAIDVRVIERLPLHRGLGAGTQVSLATVAAVRALLEMSPVSAEQLAVVAGRGARSAVGAHGFERGGLIWETGRLPGDRLGSLAERAALPDEWRAVLIVPQREEGLSGPAETAAFDRLPPPLPVISERLVELAEQAILPAAKSGDFDVFASAIYEYGRLSGGLFAPVQGGEYASPLIARRVAILRGAGIAGAGQSSWGPTVYAFAPNQRFADELVSDLRSESAFSGCDMTVVCSENRPATIRSTARLASKQ